MGQEERQATMYSWLSPKALLRWSMAGDTCQAESVHL